MRFEIPSADLNGRLSEENQLPCGIRSILPLLAKLSFFPERLFVRSSDHNSIHGTLALMSDCDSLVLMSVHDSLALMSVISLVRP